MGHGERLKIFAKTCFGTQRAFGEALGMKDAQLSDYVRERFFPGQALLEGFVRLGGNAHWLLTGEGSMCTPKRGAVDHAGMVEPTEPTNTIGELRSVIARAAVLVEELGGSELEKMQRN
jgi:hypothetical protein